MPNGEKPYDFVPFPEGSPKRERVKGQSAYHSDCLTGWLELKLKTLTPVHVASGFMDFVSAGGQEVLASLQSSIRKHGDSGVKRTYVLPGSSLKGAIRSLVEALSPSCVRVVSGMTRKTVPQRFSPCKPPDLCPACRLFGAQDYQGQLSFEDALVPSGSLARFGTPILWTPARGAKTLPSCYLDPQGQLLGRKVYYHYEPATGPDSRALVKRGVRIPCRIHFHNLANGELGLLITALGLNPNHPFPIKVGAGKPVGLGSVQVHLQALILLQGNQSVRQVGRLGAMSAQRLTEEDLQNTLQTLCQTALEDGLLLEEQLAELASIYDPAGLGETAPDEPY
ncbi:MAG: RAMP superfamily CRISPR-associated protein [Fimbriimonadales bacterium]